MSAADLFGVMRLLFAASLIGMEQAVASSRSSRAGQLEEAELMSRLGQGDIGALADLYGRFAQRVYRFLAHSIGGIAPDEAEDLCQEVFVTLLDTARRYQEQGQLKSWIYGIARAKARGYRRRRFFRSRILRVHEIECSSSATSAVPPSGEQVERVGLALERLSDSERQIVLMSLGEEMKPREIAAALGIDPNAARVRLHRARTAFREALFAVDRGQEGKDK